VTNDDDVQLNSIHDVQDQYRAVAFDEYDTGAHFERLMQAFLQTEPQYEALDDEVWRRIEYAEQGIRTDTGIDSVVRNRDTGEPLDWIIERYQVKSDKASEIMNDPNAWGDEHGDPRYILDLIKRITTVSIETVKIVNELPSLEVVGA
jgi:predicted helicase